MGVSRRSHAGIGRVRDSRSNQASVSQNPGRAHDVDKRREVFGERARAAGAAAFLKKAVLFSRRRCSAAQLFRISGAGPAAIMIMRVGRRRNEMIEQRCCFTVRTVILLATRESYATLSSSQLPLHCGAIPKQAFDPVEQISIVARHDLKR